MNDTTATRGDAHRYIADTLGEYLEDYDTEAIADDVYGQLGHWNFGVMDDPDYFDVEVEPVDYWAAVRRHEI